MSASYRLDGDLSVARVKVAFAAVVNRHAILRTTHQSEDTAGLAQTVHKRLTPRWAEHDLTHLAERARNLRLEVLAQREFGGPFDLTADAPLRVTLIRTGPCEHVLLLVAHRLAWDDASWGVLLDELGQAYADPGGYGAKPSVPLSAGPRRTADVAGGGDPGYWRTVFAELPEPLEFPGPNGSAMAVATHAAVCTRHLTANMMDRVGRLADGIGATRHMVMIAAVSALITRYTQTGDFFIALPTDDRSAETTQSIGNFGITGLLRAKVSPRNTFRELLSRTRDGVIAALSHRRGMPDGVLGESGTDCGRAGVEGLARVSVGLREAEGDTLCLCGVRCERVQLRGQGARRPLGVTVELTADGALVRAEYMVGILDRALVAQMLKHLEQLLDSALRQPDTPIHALDMLCADDAAWLGRASRGEDAQVTPTTLCEIVERQAEATPDAVAVTCEGRHFTYRDINQRANRLAHWLIERRIGPEDLVAVVLARSPQLVITALGIAKAGAAYLPVDPDYPADRIEFILQDSAPRLVLREPVDDRERLDRYPTTNPADLERLRPLLPANLAYVIYTSGSTGTPKGVPVAHAAVAEYFAWFAGEYEAGDREAVLQVTSSGFDFSIEEIFGTLGRGARLVIPRSGGLRDIGYLTDLLRREGITTMHLLPSMLGLFLSFPGVSQWRTLRRIPIGGEPLPGELADKFYATFDAALLNFYGPTETTIAATRYRVTGTQANRTVPIGSPKINTTVHLLDDTLRPVPIGAIGHIYIGGTCLARGYLGLPGLTAQRFVADPHRIGERLYRTGDLARRNAGGDLEFIGRADEQAKVRGFRIELGEVAAAVSVDPSVAQCVVVVRELSSTGRGLVAYMTPSANHETVDVGRVRARVNAALPRHMTPAAYVVIDEIPITTHGKFDRDALPDPDFGRHDVTPVSPARSTEAVDRVGRLMEAAI